MPRIIAGQARGTQLAAPAGQHTRPTSDRTKEALFSILSPRLPGARFLDLFAGSGQIGLEALSRGADEAVFIEKERRALAAIHANIERTHLKAGARVLPLDAAAALRRLESERLAGNGRPFDIIFLDPPYAEALQLLEKLARLMGPAADVTAADPSAEPAGPSGDAASMSVEPAGPSGDMADTSAEPAKPARKIPTSDVSSDTVATGSGIFESAGLLAPGGILVLEHDSRQAPQPTVTFLKLVRSCKYGTAMLSFYQNRQIDG